MIKRFLQRWLGIQELSDKLTMQKPRRSPKIIEPEDKSDMWPEVDKFEMLDSEPAIKKGYGKKH